MKEKHNKLHLSHMTITAGPAHQRVNTETYSLFGAEARDDKSFAVDLGKVSSC